MGGSLLAAGRVHGARDRGGHRLAPVIRRGLTSRLLGWLVLFLAGGLAGLPLVYAGCLAAVPFLLMRPGGAGRKADRGWPG